MKVIPQAFQFTYEGHSGGCTKIHFAPNPRYSPLTYQQRVLHAMEEPSKSRNQMTEYVPSKPSIRTQ